MYVYFASCKNRIKIGRSSDVSKRIRGMQTGAPAEIVLEHTIECNDVKHSVYLEQILHHAFRRQRCHGEWFKKSGPIAKFLHAAQNGNESAAKKVLASLHPGMSPRQIKPGRHVD